MFLLNIYLFRFTTVLTKNTKSKSKYNDMVRITEKHNNSSILEAIEAIFF